jgi:hypothetical protein
VTSSKTSKGHAEYDPSFELMRRCRHASASVGVRIYVYGGLKGGKVFFSFFFHWEAYWSVYTVVVLPSLHLSSSYVSRF